MTPKIKYLCAALFVLLMFGCSKNIVLHVDGMPVSNYEYIARDRDTGISITYVLARYYKQDEGEGEFLIVPEYLDAWDEDIVINPKDTERLVLHIKIVNLNREEYTLWYDLSLKDYTRHELLYSGHISRKDFALELPIEPGQRVSYHLFFIDETGDEFYGIGYPKLTYKTKGGVKTHVIKNR